MVVCDPGSKLQPVSLPAALTLLLQTSTTSYISNAMCRYCIMSVFELHCTALDNKRLYTLHLRYCCRVEICRICSSRTLLLGGPEVVGRGMNSHISSEQRSGSRTKPRAKPPRLISAKSQSKPRGNWENIGPCIIIELEGLGTRVHFIFEPLYGCYCYYNQMHDF